MATHETDFPYTEVREPSGNYWQTIQQALDAGHSEDQIWSVCAEDVADDAVAWTYGPSHHYVNLIGYTVTQERHDGETYYVVIDQLDNLDD